MLARIFLAGTLGTTLAFSPSPLPENCPLPDDCPGVGARLRPSQMRQVAGGVRCGTGFRFEHGGFKTADPTFCPTAIVYEPPHTELLDKRNTHIERVDTNPILTFRYECVASTKLLFITLETACVGKDPIITGRLPMHIEMPCGTTASSVGGA